MDPQSLNRSERSGGIVIRCHGQAAQRQVPPHSTHKGSCLLGLVVLQPRATGHLSLLAVPQWWMDVLRRIVLEASTCGLSTLFQEPHQGKPSGGWEEHGSNLAADSIQMGKGTVAAVRGGWEERTTTWDLRHSWLGGTGHGAAVPADRSSCGYCVGRGSWLHEADTQWQLCCCACLYLRPAGSTVQLLLCSTPSGNC